MNDMFFVRRAQLFHPDSEGDFSSSPSVFCPKLPSKTNHCSSQWNQPTTFLIDVTSTRGRKTVSCERNYRRRSRTKRDNLSDSFPDETQRKTIDTIIVLAAMIETSLLYSNIKMREEL